MRKCVTIFNIKYVLLEYKLSRVNGQFLPQLCSPKSSAERFCFQVIHLGIRSHGVGMTDRDIQYELLSRLNNVF